jgi:hypothetical protein
VRANSSGDPAARIRSETAVQTSATAASGSPGLSTSPGNSRAYVESMLAKQDVSVCPPTGRTAPSLTEQSPEFRRSGAHEGPEIPVNTKVWRLCALVRRVSTTPGRARGAALRSRQEAVSAESRAENQRKPRAYGKICSFPAAPDVLGSRVCLQVFGSEEPDLPETLTFRARNGRRVPIFCGTPESRRPPIATLLPADKGGHQIRAVDVARIGAGQRHVRRHRVLARRARSRVSSKRSDCRSLTAGGVDDRPSVVIALDELGALAERRVRFPLRAVKQPRRWGRRAVGPNTRIHERAVIWPADPRPPGCCSRPKAAVSVASRGPLCTRPLNCYRNPLAWQAVA